VKKRRYKDDEIIDGLRSGNDAILNFIYENYYGVVQKLVRKSFGTESQARDLFQEVIIVIYTKLQTGSFKITSSFFTFFYAVAKYTWLDYRKIKYKNPLRNSTGYHDVWQIDEETEQVEVLALMALRNKLFFKHFNALSETCQTMLRLSMADYSSDEIAIELELKNVTYVRKRRSDCLQFLIEMMKKDAVFKELL
jgi:RNA polymerase sigma factor (sigma-70 family)